MELFEDSTHSFVVKISIEEKQEDEGNRLWQGEITHVSSGSHYLFDQWGKMEVFLQSHLKEDRKPSQSRFTWNKRWPRSQTRHMDD